MKTRHSTANRKFFFSALIAATILMTSFSGVSLAENWELRTAAIEVTGTRDIEAGDIDKGIRVLVRRQRQR